MGRVTCAAIPSWTGVGIARQVCAGVSCRHSPRHRWKSGSFLDRKRLHDGQRFISVAISAVLNLLEKQSFEQATRAPLILTFFDQRERALLCTFEERLKRDFNNSTAPRGFSQFFAPGVTLPTFHFAPVNGRSACAKGGVAEQKPFCLGSSPLPGLASNPCNFACHLLETLGYRCFH